MGMIESNPAGGELVQIWRLMNCAAITGKTFISNVIRHDDHNVGA